jgi:DNA-binding transcriptional LysR family regulator
MQESDRNRALPNRTSAFRGVDLNLFVVFTAIYELKSVTAAAKALNLTQPAVSHALGRLREALDDEIFVRLGNNVVPTPFATEIIDDVYTALDALKSGPLGNKHFDPKDASSVFRIAMSGGMEMFLLPKLVSYFDNHAPGIKIITTRLSPQNAVEALARGRINLAIEGEEPENLSIHRKHLATDQLVVAARKGHALFSPELSKENYLNAQHILVADSEDKGGVEDYELARLDIKRQVAVRCAVLSAALRTAAITDYLVTLGRQQLNVLEPFHNLAIADFPFQHSAQRAIMQWHDITDKDPANRWLRAIVEDFFNDLP